MPSYYIYCRKSTEAEDRQVLSIESQVAEMTRLAALRGLTVKEILTEARTAKEPGRPVFQTMMHRLHCGEAQGIICWKLDRLARNPVDGGAVIWSLKESAIEIVTPTQTFRHADDNTILLYIEFGMAQKYIDDLSRNVRRGLQTKVDQGWYPSGAPLGYVNHSTPRGEKIIAPDPERFSLVRQMWDLMLTGTHSPLQICRVANEEWGFRTRQTRKAGGKPLARSAIYRVFTEPFYCGRFEYPRGSGRWYQGRHEPMVTEAEYDRVQRLLGRHGPRRTVRLTFPFTGLIRCGECGAQVTAEEKHQIICPQCKYKFASLNAHRCPRCGIAVAEMRSPTKLRYVYYHCTKKRAQRCRQRSVRAEVLEEQVEASLARLWIPPDIVEWALGLLADIEREEFTEAQHVRDTQQRALKNCLAQLDNLVRLKTAAANVDGTLLSDAEYEHQRGALLREKVVLEAQLGEGNGPLQDAFDETKRIFQFAHLARESFVSGDDDNKRQIVTAIGSNLTLTDRKLRIQAQKPFQIIAESVLGPDGASGGFEPEENGPECTQSGPFGVGLRAGLGIRDDVRTLGRSGRWICAVRGIISFLLERSNKMNIPELHQNLKHPRREFCDKRTTQPPEEKDVLRAA